MERSKKLFKLIPLYLSYHLNKVTLILFGVFLLIWSIVLILNTGIPLDMEKYIVSYFGYHLNYLEQSIFFLEITDGVFVAFLIGAELSTLSRFDPMFVPNTSRIKIVLSKLLANFILLMTLLLFQIGLLYFIGVMVFPNFTVEGRDLLLILYIALPFIELLLIGEFLSILINSYFIPILIFVIHILSITLLKIENISKILWIFLPQVKLSANQFILHGNLFIYFGICSLIGIGIALLYQKKDIKSS